MINGLSDNSKVPCDILLDLLVVCGNWQAVVVGSVSLLLSGCLSVIWHASHSF
jgi:hypothetical protein